MDCDSSTNKYYLKTNDASEWHANCFLSTRGHSALRFVLATIAKSTMDGIVEAWTNCVPVLTRYTERFNSNLMMTEMFTPHPDSSHVPLHGRNNWRCWVSTLENHCILTMNIYFIHFMTITYYVLYDNEINIEKKKLKKIQSCQCLYFTFNSFKLNVSFHWGTKRSCF